MHFLFEYKTHVTKQTVYFFKTIVTTISIIDSIFYYSYKFFGHHYKRFLLFL